MADCETRMLGGICGAVVLEVFLVRGLNSCDVGSGAGMAGLCHDCEVVTRHHLGDPDGYDSFIGA